jgi:hypothetical protein
MHTHAYIANGRGTAGPPRDGPGYSGHHSPHVTQGYPPPPTAGARGTQVGSMPDTALLPQLPVFTPASLPSPGLDILAAAATTSQAKTLLPQAVTPALTTPGPYNPAASLPPKVVKKILDLEFVEMAELKADIWVDEPPASDVGHLARRPSSKPPVTDIRIWLECFARMAAVLVTRFPEKGPELWAYQTTILRAAHNYEGSNWVAYNRQFRRDMLARKDLNWSSPNARLYNEAFTGRAKTIPRCPYCLCEDHAGASCPHNPNPMMVGWFPDPGQLTWPLPPLNIQGGGRQQEVCRNFNENRCRFARCRFLHSCVDCSGPHPAVFCPRRTTGLPGGPPARGRTASRGRQAQAHPYFTGQHR